MNWYKLALITTSLWVLAGCDNSKAVDVPAELVDIKPVLQIKRLWSSSLGGGANRLRLGLQPSVANGVLYAADYKGEVLALTAATGKRVWLNKTKLALSAGPVVGEDLVVVGSVDGELLALSLTTGQERWRHQMASEMLSKALVANGTVVVRTVDGRLQGLNSSDGSVRWTYEGVVPKLSLRGTAPPVLAEAANAVVAGFDDGKLVAVDIQTGDILWSVAIDTPSGRTELARLADIDAAAAVSNKDVFVAGYQGKVAMLDLDNGQTWWSKDASSYRGFGLDDSVLYLSKASGEITALRRTDGNEQWQQSALLHRGLTAPVVLENSLVVGDYEGYLHWLSKVDGSIQARAKTDGERITNAPIVAEGRIFVQTDGGKLVAFQTKPKG
ncbi:MAG: outer membrane protein assembly factor BamB [Steroidobacteraceae bacterium]